MSAKLYEAFQKFMQIYNMFMTLVISFDSEMLRSDRLKYIVSWWLTIRLPLHAYMTQKSNDENKMNFLMIYIESDMKQRSAWEKIDFGFINGLHKQRARLIHESVK